uniref:hypothetical protein n=1 Tax=Altererythrobacter segetis TaxID=1104773 RepID=UPI00140B377A|nr:hypothetical protein [Altererythrobacter segetis]
MGEYEPDDSRDVTLSDHQAPGEPPRTGPREDEARAMARPKEKQGGADPEPQDKPTARDALGNKAPGFASDEVEADEDSVPLGK